MADQLDDDPSHWQERDGPRVPPLDVAELNVAVRGLVKAAELTVGGGSPPNIFLTSAGIHVCSRPGSRSPHR
jgi:hypothetical protein